MSFPLGIAPLARLLCIVSLLLTGAAIARAETTQPPVVLKVYSDYV